MASRAPCTVERIRHLEGVARCRLPCLRIRELSRVQTLVAAVDEWSARAAALRARRGDERVRLDEAVALLAEADKAKMLTTWFIRDNDPKEAEFGKLGAGIRINPIFARIAQGAQVRDRQLVAHEGKTSLAQHFLIFSEHKCHGISLRF